MKKNEVKSKKKGVARASIASKRDGAMTAIPKKDDDDSDIIMGDADNEGTRKRKRALLKSRQV